MPHRNNYMLILILGSVYAFGGRLDLIRQMGVKHSVLVPLSAHVQDVVELTIEDSPGADLVSARGIDFGRVNSLGISSTPGVTSSQIGQKGHYEAEFMFNVGRSGQGRLNLYARRSIAGNFHSHDGIEIDNYHGALRPLAALDMQGTLVLSEVLSGAYERTIAINIYPQDKGHLKTVLEFTLCAL